MLKKDQQYCQVFHTTWAHALSVNSIIGGRIIKDILWARLILVFPALDHYSVPNTAQTHALLLTNKMPGIQISHQFSLKC